MIATVMDISDTLLSPLAGMSKSRKYALFEDVSLTNRRKYIHTYTYSIYDGTAFCICLMATD